MNKTKKTFWIAVRPKTGEVLNGSQYYAYWTKGGLPRFWNGKGYILAALNRKAKDLQESLYVNNHYKDLADRLVDPYDFFSPGDELHIISYEFNADPNLPPTQWGFVKTATKTYWLEPLTLEIQEKP